MPFNLSMTHLMVVGIVALVVLGPERLPGVARTAGQLYREWQRIRGELEGEVREAIAEFKEPFAEAAAPATRGTGPAAPLTGGLPRLGPDTGLMTPGPSVDGAAPPEMPLLGPPPAPGTFVARPE